MNVEGGYLMSNVFVRGCFSPFITILNQNVLHPSPSHLG